MLEILTNGITEKLFCKEKRKKLKRSLKKKKKRENKKKKRKSKSKQVEVLHGKHLEKVLHTEVNLFKSLIIILDSLENFATVMAAKKKAELAIAERELMEKQRK